tara:strand:- start:3538 stop:4188 length:651 start_codon:yes stop_codon:yes gene_type:complete
MTSKPNIVLFGPPGAGKGTQANLLKERLGINHISSGDLFRYHLRNRSPLGIKASEFMNAGLLVPDELTIEIILDKLRELPSDQGFMLDGFPRTLSQAKALSTQLDQCSMSIDAVIFINVDESELLKRLSGRYICENCQAPHNMVESTSNNSSCNQCNGNLYQREDDKPEAVNKRIEIYRNETVPVLDYYKSQNILHDISGMGPVEDINSSILDSLK